MTSRSVLAAAAVGLLWTGVIIRAANIVASGEDMRQTANRQRVRAVDVPAQPGRIEDRRGRPLAVSVQRPSLFVDPSRVDDPVHTATLLADATGIARESIEEIIRDDPSRQFAWLQRRVEPEVAGAVLAVDGFPARAVGIRPEWRRIYPLNDAAAHLLGLRGLDGVARGGVEELFADRIAGKPGRRRTVVDSRGRVLSSLTQVSRPPLDGDTIRLTLDSRIQTVASRRLEQLSAEWSPAWSAAVVIDVTTGDLLAVASRPSYDANDPVDIATAGFHHAFRGTFEPGSVMKPIVVAAALDAGVIAADEEIDCGPGRAVVAGRPMRDASANGVRPLAEVISRSSNIGAARVAEKLGTRQLEAALRRFGFGRAVPLELPIAETGLLRPLSEWSGYSLGSLAMGHELSATPLQLATAYATLCRGTAVRPRLVLSDQTTVELGSQVVTQQASTWTVGTAMRLAVASGTAKAANLPGLSVFGKTGTAQKFDVELGEYSRTRATCVFCGGVPAESPRIVVVVVADDPRPEDGRTVSGGKVAAPAARDIIAEAWRLHGPTAGER